MILTCFRPSAQEVQVCFKADLGMFFVRWFWTDQNINKTCDSKNRHDTF